VFAVGVPRQLIFAYIDTIHHFFIQEETEGVQQIQFFIDPLNGMVYTQTDVLTYLKKINATDNESYFLPLPTQKIIYNMLEELAQCFRYRKEDDKADEIQDLMKIIEDNNNQ
jgi:hypothetical protein